MRDVWGKYCKWVHDNEMIRHYQQGIKRRRDTKPNTDYHEDRLEMKQYVLHVRMIMQPAVMHDELGRDRDHHTSHN